MMSGATIVMKSAVRRLAANATTKLSRYRPSGSTHSIGIATMSVVRCVVVDSIRPDGIAASAIQCNTRRVAGFGAVSSGNFSTAWPGTVTAQPTTSSTSKA